MDSGVRGAEKILDSGNKPDAFMAATDVMAIGVIKCLKNRGISVPEDVNVIGFDNIPLTTLIEPSLTTIAQPIKKLGIEAMNILIKKINNDSYSAQVELDGKLIVRGSTEKRKEDGDEVNKSYLY